ncbi:MAG: hypothetical protein LBU07_03355 [Coriobacteriales bacterium]|jgi:hypothetical protein|nr:hypothetical protein [Coriobacteriales bacterium]
MDTEKGPEPIDTQSKQAGSQWQPYSAPQGFMKALVLGIGLSALAILEIVVLGSWVLVEESRLWSMGFPPFFVLALLWLILAFLCMLLLCFVNKREIDESNANADGTPIEKGRRVLVTREGPKLFFVFLGVGAATSLLPLFHWFNSEFAGTIFALGVVIVASLWALRMFYRRVVKTKRIGYITLAAWMISSNLAYFLGYLLAGFGPYQWLSSILKNLA